MITSGTLPVLPALQIKPIWRFNRISRGNTYDTRDANDLLRVPLLRSGVAHAVVETPPSRVARAAPWRRCLISQRTRRRLITHPTASRTSCRLDPNETHSS